MVKVIIKNDRFFEKSMKKFSRKVDKVGIIKEVRSRTYYEKPSVKRKRRLTESLRRRKKAARKIQLFQEKQESSRKRKWTSPIKEQLAREKAYYRLKSRE